MMVALSASGWAYRAHIVFKITIESLMLTIFNLEVRKILTAVLSSQRPFFHINVLLILFLLLRVQIITTRVYVVIILIVKRAI